MDNNNSNNNNNKPTTVHVKFCIINLLYSTSGTFKLDLFSYIHLLLCIYTIKCKGIHSGE